MRWRIGSGASTNRSASGPRRAAGVDDAHALGELLNDHVRFEERELFEFLEARLTQAELDRLGREIEAARPS